MRYGNSFKGYRTEFFIAGYKRMNNDHLTTGKTGGVSMMEGGAGTTLAIKYNRQQNIKRNLKKKKNRYMSNQ